MSSQVNQLKERILGKRNKSKETKLTGIFDMIREFGCFGEIVGRDFEIRDPKGNLVYNVHQKPINIKQLQTFLKEFHTLKKIDNEKEAAKWGNKNKPKRK